MKPKPNALCIHEYRPFGSNYTPRDLIVSHVRKHPHLFRPGQAYWDGRYEVLFQGKPYEYDHWQIEPDPKSRTEHITLFLTERRKEN